MLNEMSDGNFAIDTECERGDDAGREGRVVAAAVLHVQQQGNVQHVGLEVGVLPVSYTHLKVADWRNGQPWQHFEV